MYEDLMRLFEGTDGGFALYMTLEEWILSRCPGSEIRPKKTQAGFFDGCCYAVISPPLRGKAGVNLTLCLPEKLESDRVFAASEPYPGRWTHHIPVYHSSELDAELASWLDSAHEFARQRRRK